MADTCPAVPITTPFEQLSGIVRDFERDGIGGIRLTGDDQRRDPFLIAAALAARTREIRIVVEVSTGATHPYALARKLAGVDKISSGRLSWAPHDAVPERRDEAIRVVARLLRSWPPEALVRDRAGGVHVDTDLVRTVRHDGRYYRVRSPLDVPAGPQGEVPIVEEENR